MKYITIISLILMILLNILIAFLEKGLKEANDPGGFYIYIFFYPQMAISFIGTFCLFFIIWVTSKNYYPLLFRVIAGLLLINALVPTTRFNPKVQDYLARHQWSEQQEQEREKWVTRNEQIRLCEDHARNPKIMDQLLHYLGEYPHALEQPDPYNSKAITGSIIRHFHVENVTPDDILKFFLTKFVDAAKDKLDPKVKFNWNGKNVSILASSNSKFLELYKKNSGVIYTVTLEIPEINEIYNGCISSYTSEPNF